MAKQSIGKVQRYTIGLARYYFERLPVWREYLKFLLCAPMQWRERVQIIRRWRHIHRLVPCAHSEWELLPLANEILRIPREWEGDIIECGVYKGGSTCKLSVVAKLVGRKLLACDSFSGLPAPEEFDRKHYLSNGQVYIYKQGDYLATIEEVRNSISLFGEPDTVELVPGYFHQSLPTLKQKKFVFIFIDVDLYESIVCCIKNLYPLLQPGCKFFTHEAGHLLTHKAFTDKEFWKSRFGVAPLKFERVKAGLGLSSIIGYVQKPSNSTST